MLLRTEPGWKKLTLASLVALLASACPAGATDPLMNTGLQYFNKRDYRSAAHYFEQAIASAPWDSTALYYCGLAYHQMGDTPKAIEKYRTILEKFPGSAAYNHALAAMQGIDPQWVRQFQAGGSTKQATPVQAATPASAQAAGGKKAEVDHIDLSKCPDQCRIYYTQKDDNHIISAQINGRNIAMKFDTGAHETVLGKNHLAQLGIPQPTGKPTGQIASRDSAKPVDVWHMKANIKVGDIEQSNFPIAVQEKLDGEPMLGQSFLSHFACTVDTRAKCIVLQKRSAAGATASSGTARSGSRSEVQFRRQGKDMIVNVSIDGRQVPMIFDTGASGITFSEKQARDAGLKVSEENIEVTTTTDPASGTETKTKELTIKRMTLGPVEKRDIKISIVETAKTTYPLLGPAFFGDWRYTVDNAAGLIHFQR